MASRVLFLRDKTGRHLEALRALAAAHEATTGCRPSLSALAWRILSGALVNPDFLREIGLYPGGRSN